MVTMNNIYYNTPTILLLKWARVYLQRKVFSNYLERLASEIWEFEETPEPYILEDVSLIIQQAKLGKEYLSQETILGITTDDCEWNNSIIAFEQIDNLIFISEAIENLFKDKNPSFTEQCFEILDVELIQMSDFFYDGDVSPLRWVQFNKIRKRKLDVIKSQEHYQFPWYELMIDEPSDLLSLLGSCFHILTNNSQINNLPDVLKKNLEIYTYEINRDEKLKRFLIQQNEVSLALEETFSTHKAFSIWHAGRYIGYEKIIPEEVDKIGYEKVTKKILNNKSENKQNQLILKMSEACFAPGIDSHQRVQMLLRCEEDLKQLSIDSDNDSIVSSHEPAVAFHNLYTDHCTSEDVANSLYDFWNKQIVYVVNEKND